MCNGGVFTVYVWYTRLIPKFILYAMVVVFVVYNLFIVTLVSQRNLNGSHRESFCLVNHRK